MRLRMRGIDEVIASLDEARDRFNDDAEEAVAISVRDVQEYARMHHDWTTRTGKAERSIEAEVRRKGSVVTGTVYTALDYGVYLHEGTKAHLIEPRRKKALRWTQGNQFRFARRVRHPGYAGDPYIYNALDAEESVIRSRFDLLAARFAKGGV